MSDIMQTNRVKAEAPDASTEPTTRPQKAKQHVTNEESIPLWAQAWGDQVPDNLQAKPAVNQPGTATLGAETNQQSGISPSAPPKPLIHRMPVTLLGASVAPQSQHPSLSTEEQKEQQKIEIALQTNSLSRALNVRNFRHATEEQKIGLIRIVLDRGKDAGEVQQQQIQRIWASFADQLPSVTERYRKEWQRSADLTPPFFPVTNLPAVKKVQGAFINDINQVVTENLFANRQYLLERRKLHGLGDTKPLTDTAYKDLRVSIQEMAYHVWELKQAQKKLKNTTIGYRPVAFSIPEGAKFDPEKKATGISSYGRAVPKWEDLKVAWDVAADEIARVAGRYPEIYAALASNKPEEDLLFLARVIPDSFSSKVGMLLDGLLQRIDNIQIKLQKHEINVLDLQPVHARLFQGLQVASNKRWGDATSFDQWAAKRLISEHEQSEKTTKFLLSAVEITALLVASFATAGSLTFFLAAAIAVGTPAIQGAIDWQKATEQEQMAKATPLQGTELITQAKADAKKAQAKSELIRALINAVTLGVTAGVKGAAPKLGAEAAGASSGFSKTELAIVEEVKGIQSSPELVELRAAAQANKAARIRYGQRYIQFDPGAPVGKGYYAMTDFEGNGFSLFPDAFSSEEHLTKTLLWEIHRLTTSVSKATGVSGEIAAAESNAAQNFSESAFKAFFSGQQ